MNTKTMNEKNVRRLVAGRRAEAEVAEPLTPEELAEREAEKAALIASLERAEHPEPSYELQATAAIDKMLGELGEPITKQPEDEDDDVPEPPTVGEMPDAETLALGERMIRRAAVAERAAQDADDHILADARARLKPAREAAKLAVYEVRKLQREYQGKLDVLESLDWKFLHNMLAATVYHRRVTETHGALATVLDTFRNIEETWARLRDSLKSLSLMRITTDRSLVPTLEQHLRWLADRPYGAKQDVYRLKDAVQKLDQAMQAHEAETTPPVSEDAKATADTRESSRDIMRAELDPLPAQPDDVKQAPGRVKDRNVFDV